MVGNGLANRLSVMGALGIILLLSSQWTHGAGEIYRDPTKPVADRVGDLLGRMTLEEKVGQMTQVNVTRLMSGNGWGRGLLDRKWLQTVLADEKVGSILSGGGAAPVPNTPGDWAAMTNEIQRYAMEHSRLGIPIIYGVDAVHGHNNVLGATIFPHNIGLAATWDPSLAEATAASTTRAVRATGIHRTFGPVSDIGRDLRWGRFYETFGEDPYLASAFTSAAVRGYQGKQGPGPDTIAASAKHFLGYSMPLNGFDRSPADISLRTLRDVVFPPFQSAIDAGTATVMTNSGSVNGIPVHASRYLLTDVLRDQMGFKGVVVTDWQDFHKLVDVYHVAKDLKEAVRLGIMAGNDMYMVPVDVRGFTRNLMTLVREGSVPMERIDGSVARILELKFRLGLFEKPYVDEAMANPTLVGADRELARRSTTESITLLRNDGVLPLSKAIGEITVAGSCSDSPANQMGGWTIEWQGVGKGIPPNVTVLGGIRKALAGKAKVTHAGNDLTAAKAAAKRSDAVVVVVGEKPYAEEQGDTATAELNASDKALIMGLASVGKPVIVVMLSGRPLMVSDFMDQVQAFLMAYLPGTEAGTAVASVLFGEHNPSGRLPFSWPRGMGQIPLTYDYRAGTGYAPLFPFGFGLGYTTYGYSGLKASGAGVGDPVIKASVDVTNTGTVAGDEVVQVYASRAVSPVLAPVKRLVAFAKVSLAPGGTKTVNLDIPTETLKVVTGDILGEGPRVLVPGSYTLTVGGLSAEVRIRGE